VNKDETNPVEAVTIPVDKEENAASCDSKVMAEMVEKYPRFPKKSPEEKLRAMAVEIVTLLPAK
jgi:hypothetical protein